MSLITDVKKICKRLAPSGWHKLLVQHGLDITANDLESELLKELTMINRKISGFQDFAPDGKRGIEPGNPSHSLLYHAFASPNVISVDGQRLKDFPTLAEIDKVENYVFGIQTPTLSKIAAKAQELSGGAAYVLAISVFASEYRPGPETVHKNHADLCFSRTGVSRVGTAEPLYDKLRRGFLSINEKDNHAFRVLPARYSAYVAVQLKGNESMFGPMRFNLSDQLDGTRNFWIPLHKLFNGDECISGFMLNVMWKAHHVNEKIRRIHIQLEKIPNYPRTSKDVLEKPPYKFTAGIAELSTNPDFGPGVLIPVAHPKVVEKVIHNGKPLSFWVPSKHKDKLAKTIIDNYSSTLKINADSKIDPDNPYRHAPEYVNIRHKVLDNGNVENLNDSKNMIDQIRDGHYQAQHFIDFTADGWVEISCPALAIDLPRPPIPAYSLVTAPDFFMSVDQGDIMDWYIRNVPKALKNDLWYNPPTGNNLQTLSDERLAPNIELNSSLETGVVNSPFPFRPEDDSVTAIVSLPIKNRDMKKSSQFKVGDTMRHVYLPDAASGVFAPGWDVSIDYSRGTKHLAAYGLGSPFPEDSKLCAALSSFWPAVAPDAGRSFWWSDFKGVYPTISPLTDEEIGDLPWDGVTGPKLSSKNSDFIEYYKVEYVDYVDNSLQKKFTLNLTEKISNIEYKSRILAMARGYQAAGIISRPTRGRIDKFYWPVSSFRKVTSKDKEVIQAEGQSSTQIHDRIYRIEIIRGEEAPALSNNLKKIKIKILERFLLFIGSGNDVLIKHNNDDWKSVSTG